MKEEPDITRAELKKKINERRRRATPEELDTAVKEAKYRTFQKELGKTGKTVLDFKNSSLFGKIVGLTTFPFVKTLVNLSKFTIERTPLAWARLAYKVAEGSYKDMSPLEKDEAVTRAIYGTMGAIGLYVIASAGMITGGGPDREDEKQKMIRAGWQPYSIRVPGLGYFSYKRIEPFASMLGLVADFVEIQADMSEKGKENIFLSIAKTIHKNLLNKTMLSGINELFKFSSDPYRNGGKFITNWLVTFTPWSGALRSVGLSTHPYLKDTDSYGNSWIGNGIVGVSKQFMNIIPGMRMMLPTKLDYFGRKIEVNRPWNNWEDIGVIPKTSRALWNLIMPFPVSGGKPDKVDMEIMKLNYTPNLPEKTLDLMGMKKVKLTSDEYWWYVENSGKEAKKNLDRIVNAPSWDKRKDKQKESIFEDAFRKSRKKWRTSLWKNMSSDRKKEVMEIHKLKNQ
jgi:hypothetical protein